VSAPTSPGRATIGIVTGSLPRTDATRLRMPATVERSMVVGRWCFAASRPAAMPSTRGVSETIAATSSRPAAAASTCPPDSETPQSTSRRASAPGNRAAAAIAAR
jgi:hypothetical protein